jgi:hypothetical protein
MNIVVDLDIPKRRTPAHAVSLNLKGLVMGLLAAGSYGPRES